MSNKHLTNVLWVAVFGGCFVFAVAVFGPWPSTEGKDDNISKATYTTDDAWRDAVVQEMHEIPKTDLVQVRFGLADQPDAWWSAVTPKSNGLVVGARINVMQYSHKHTSRPTSRNNPYDSVLIVEVVPATQPSK